MSDLPPKMIVSLAYQNGHNKNNCYIGKRTDGHWFVLSLSHSSIFFYGAKLHVQFLILCYKIKFWLVDGRFKQPEQMLDNNYHYFIHCEGYLGVDYLFMARILFLFTRFNCIISDLHFWLLQIFLSFALNMAELALIIFLITDMKMFKIVC